MAVTTILSLSLSFSAYTNTLDDFGEKTMIVITETRKRKKESPGRLGKGTWEYRFKIKRMRRRRRHFITRDDSKTIGDLSFVSARSSKENLRRRRRKDCLSLSTLVFVCRSQENFGEQEMRHRCPSGCSFGATGSCITITNVHTRPLF